MMPVREVPTFLEGREERSTLCFRASIPAHEKFFMNNEEKIMELSSDNYTQCYLCCVWLSGESSMIFSSCIALCVYSREAVLFRTILVKE